MREIKFRGKSKMAGEWLYGDLISIRQEKAVVENIDWFVDPDHAHSWCRGTIYNDELIVCEETIGQFTGLYDNTGKEIYEGDIIKTPLGHVGIVQFGKAEEYCMHKEWGRMITDVYTTYGWIFDGKIKVAIDDEILKGELIGNIFDNEELLK